eukprot:9135253-Pyramimonas_sp.AAC.1
MALNAGNKLIMHKGPSNMSPDSLRQLVKALQAKCIDQNKELTKVKSFVEKVFRAADGHSSIIAGAQQKLKQKKQKESGGTQAKTTKLDKLQKISQLPTLVCSDGGDLAME